MSATRQAGGLVNRAQAFWNSPTGLRTTHFWGPIANWGFVIAGLSDTRKPAELVSPNMTGVMCVYSLLFMRFAWAINPRNYLLFACHASNEAVQLNQMRRVLSVRDWNKFIAASYNVYNCWTFALASAEFPWLCGATVYKQ